MQPSATAGTALALLVPGAVAAASPPESIQPATPHSARTLGALPGPAASFPSERLFPAPAPVKVKRKRTRPRHVFPIRGAVSYGNAVARFGNNRGTHMHGGQDVFAKAGTPLVAVSRGIVVETGADGGRGNHIEIYDPRLKRTYAYFHMIAPATLKVGAKVRPGQRVGRVGCTGRCFGDHLHFEVHKGRGIGAPKIDPLPLLRKLHKRKLKA